MLDVTSSLRPTLATTGEELESLRPRWAALWARAPAATPFQSPDWLISWWRYFGRGELRALALWRGGTLVGLLPLFLGEGASARRLMPVGTGISDYLDVLIEPGAERPGMEAAFAHLADERWPWDRWTLPDLPPDSPLLRAALPSGWVDRRHVQETCPVLRLPERVEDLPRALPPGIMRALAYCRRRASKAGRIEVERADAERFDQLFDALLRLHGVRWRTRGHAGVLADAAVRAFHQQVGSALLEQDVLRLYALRLDHQVIAAYYGFQVDGRAYYYIGGFDPAFARISPGTLIVGHAIEQAIREGAREFHFLRGGEAYKYRWGAEDRPNHCRELWRCTESPPVD